MSFTHTRPPEVIGNLRRQTVASECLVIAPGHDGKGLCSHAIGDGVGFRTYIRKVLLRSRLRICKQCEDHNTK